MLHEAELAARRYSGHGSLWQHPYANPQPRAASALASVWFTAYPASQITRPGESVLHSLGDPELWRLFREMGITAVHTGPMKRAGGIRGREYTPTVDGNFDRISTRDRSRLRHRGRIQGDGPATRATTAPCVIGDIIPGHSGKGADFRLAERGYGDYPGLYHMVEIQPTDWSLLPDGAGRQGLDQPQARGGGSSSRRAATSSGSSRAPSSTRRTSRRPTGRPPTPSSAATARVRRWVYLHYFKEGQPSFNWLDPTFAAQRLVAGDALHSLGTLGERMLRLDANGFLGIEVGPEQRPRLVRGASAVGHRPTSSSPAWCASSAASRSRSSTSRSRTSRRCRRAAPISPTTSSPAPPTTTPSSPAMPSSCVSCSALQKTYQIDPAGLIHALQNHDELTLELVHFWTRHKDATFTFRGKSR